MIADVVKHPHPKGDNRGQDQVDPQAVAQEGQPDGQATFDSSPLMNTRLS